ncbi:hypothetical protein AAFX91_11335, partial [Bradyrhizobium sp. 31Argb]|uniref:hypothetical protein n=1 Tax=Bradyrhizobium sp. 31Argb TaxID=3141247 RepID=UPI00374819EB
LSMISAQTLRVCREGKPVSTFPDHALMSNTDLKEFYGHYIAAINARDLESVAELLHDAVTRRPPRSSCKT